MKKLFGIIAIGVLAIGLTMTSCTKEENWTDVDNFVTDTYKEFRDGALGGHHRCYKVVFPVTIIFADSTETEVFDREEFITAVRTWKENNPSTAGKPKLKLPVTIERLDGELFYVETHEQIQELRRECAVFNHKHRACKHYARFLDNKCFEVELPISVIMSDGHIIEIEKKRDIVKVLKEWKKDRPDEVPEIMFPITVTMKEDNTEVEIPDFDAWETLIEECKG
jgi:hypothetical protein